MDGNIPVRAGEAVRKHEHHLPHGGVPVALGEKEYHIEFVHEMRTGRLQVYFLDGEPENFVRVTMPSVKIAAQVAGKEKVGLNACDQQRHWRNGWRDRSI